MALLLQEHQQIKLNEKALNIISCPSCSRVENEAFIDLAQQVKAMTEYAQEHALTYCDLGAESALKTFMEAAMTDGSIEGRLTLPTRKTVPFSAKCPE